MYKVLPCLRTFALIYFFCCYAPLLAELQLIEHTVDNAIMYDRIAVTGQLDAVFYAQAVKLLPIVCIDVLVFNEAKKEYFLVYRKSKPAQNVFWVPGGRMYKGETFFECAYRKCFEEAGLKVAPKKILDVYSLEFPDSAQDCPTHTIGIAILALCEDYNPALDIFHADSKWVSIYEPADNEYVESIRKKALAALKLEN